MAEFRVEACPRLVEAWTVSRLPFEPMGWQLAFRRELRAGVAQLDVRPAEVLYAVYASTDPAMCDTENVLFYNVGPGVFTKAMRRGVRFERSYARHVGSPAEASHYYRYEPAARDDGFRWWRRGPNLRHWGNVDWPERSSAAYWWNAFSRGEPPSIDSVDTSQWFGVDVRFQAPETQEVSVHELIKPMFDGLISACHRYTGDQLEEVADRLGTALATDPAETAARLTSHHGAVLGPRRLLWPWRNSLQWNPADDRCVAAAVHVLPGANSDAPAVSADVFLAAMADELPA